MHYKTHTHTHKTNKISLENSQAGVFTKYLEQQAHLSCLSLSSVQLKSYFTLLTWTLRCTVHLARDILVLQVQSAVDY